MKLKSQVVSLELAKKLKELGVKQESWFYWALSTQGGKWELIEPWKISANMRHEVYSAYSVAELGEMLPQAIWRREQPLGILLSTSDRSYVNAAFHIPKKWKVWYEDLVTDEALVGFSEEKEADARAKMLIYLLENKLITKLKQSK